MKRGQIIPWKRENAVTTSTKSIQILQLFSEPNLDSYISRAPRQMDGWRGKIFRRRGRLREGECRYKVAAGLFKP
jgi:hypothetical protein